MPDKTRGTITPSVRQTLKYMRGSDTIRGDRQRPGRSRDRLALVLLLVIVGAALLALVHGR